MRAPILALLVVAAMGSAPGASGVLGQQPSEELLLVKQNKKYGVSCAFYGEKDYDAVSRIVVESQRGKARYRPTDPVSLVDSLGYFKDVWSPDEEYLVLPKGRWDGFCILTAPRAVTAIRGKTCSDFIRVRLEHGPALWHEFEGWDGENSFRFKAGLSNSYIHFKYSIAERKLTVFGKLTTYLVATNRTGRIEILETETEADTPPTGGARVVPLQPSVGVLGGQALGRLGP